MEGVPGCGGRGCAVAAQGVLGAAATMVLDFVECFVVTVCFATATVALDFVVCTFFTVDALVVVCLCFDCFVVTVRVHGPSGSQTGRRPRRSPSPSDNSSASDDQSWSPSPSDNSSASDEDSSIGSSSRSPSARTRLPVAAIVEGPDGESKWNNFRPQCLGRPTQSRLVKSTLGDTDPGPGDMIGEAGEPVPTASGEKATGKQVRLGPSFFSCGIPVPVERIPRGAGKNGPCARARGTSGPTSRPSSFLPRERLSFCLGGAILGSAPGCRAP